MNLYQLRYCVAIIETVRYKRLWRNSDLKLQHDLKIIIIIIIIIIISKHNVEFHFYADDTQIYATFTYNNSLMKSLKSLVKLCQCYLKSTVSANLPSFISETYPASKRTNQELQLNALFMPLLHSNWTPITLYYMVCPSTAYRNSKAYLTLLLAF